jgi:hypothetical protein
MDWFAMLGFKSALRLLAEVTGAESSGVRFGEFCEGEQEAAR